MIKRSLGISPAVAQGLYPGKEEIGVKCLKTRGDSLPHFSFCSKFLASRCFLRGTRDANHWAPHCHTALLPITALVLAGYGPPPIQQFATNTHSLTHSLTHLLTHSLTPWLYSPLTVSASLIMDVHSSLSTAFCRHLLTFNSCTSFTTFSSHLSLGLPLLLFPSGLLSNTYFTVLP